ncbi:ubiquitin-activating enzyme-like protein [Trypanosoma cruzi marinkellei]|uniref:Ubiquitin-activating enzyme-like protein n=1 Tax=Trypanosoma cruzi marinkellei TaxID=85056 RepID=K2MJL9_TRYCR|nr:ubiquitin-activating enzyme-like protein [Trypanosoma cruzi marinkellei]
MRVYIGHLLFPPKRSYSSQASCSRRDDDVGIVSKGDAKRFKGEGWATGVMDMTDVSSSQVSVDSITEAVLKAYERWVGQHEKINSKPHIDVHVHAAGKGASFCLVPGILALSLSTSACTAIVCPKKVSMADMEIAARYPRITAVSLESFNGKVWDELPVYWEERQVMVTNNLTETTMTRVVANCCVSSAENETLYGDETLMEKRILVVGAGGIGCELLKVLVLYGFRNLDVFDLDTIDATNLNRQFLFQKEDVGASKADTARKAILNWFTLSSSEQVLPVIRAHHADIKNEAYDDAFFCQFALVLNALDNVSARQHVNRMCMRADVPLIESGTMGYNGQVQPIIRGLYECYDCHPKATNQKTVAVCTIHARPTTMVHCVHYAKELYERLFGEGKREEQDEFAFVDAIITQQEEELRSEADAYDGGLSISGMAAALARSLFHEKIQELLSMKTVWATQPPVPLSTDLIQRMAEQMSVDATRVKSLQILRDAPLCLEDTVSLFLDAFTRCARRGNRDAFCKEDDNAVDFVAAVANLRAFVFHIFPLQSVEEIRSIAGAIVPAIATTNAIVAAAVVQQALCVLGMKETTCRFGKPQMVYVRRVPQVRRRPFPDVCGCNIHVSHGSDRKRNSSNDDKTGKMNDVIQKRWATDLFLVHSAPPSLPSSDCLVCRERYPTVRVFLDAIHTTLGQFLRTVLRERLSMTAASVFRGANVLYEEDEYEALAMTPLVDLMTAADRPLELLVDDLNHEVEWRLVVNHRPAMEGSDAVKLEGIDAALQLEQKLVSDSKQAAAAAENDNNNNNNNGDRVIPTKTGSVENGDDDDVVVSPSRKVMDAAAGNTATVVVVLSDSDGDDVDVVEID